MILQEEKLNALNDFLATVERRAYRTAYFAVRNQDDALDIVQDAMMTLAKSYAHKAESNWPPLFHRILQTKILDYYRRQKTKRQWFRVFSNTGEENDNTDIEHIGDSSNTTPEDKLLQHRAIEALDKAVQNLPLRQQQAFLLRTWEGLNVAETAASMGCSQGSVKTHYSRAIHSLRPVLKEFI